MKCSPGKMLDRDESLTSVIECRGHKGCMIFAVAVASQVLQMVGEEIYYS